MKILYFTILSLFLIGCSTSKKNINYKDFGDLRPSEPGKCYAKCLMPAETESIVINYFRYTGLESIDEATVRKSKIVTQEKATKWVKKKADGNCRSSNPEDCLVWCLVDVPEESIEYMEVLDTSQVKDYVTDSLVIDNINATEHTEWVETLCEKDITMAVISDMQTALLDLGYSLDQGVTGKLNKETKEELKQYQVDYELPIGALNIKTLELLGVY